MADEPEEAASSNRMRLQISEGIALARAGDHDGARAVFRRIIHQDPDNEDAWLWLAWVAESRAHSLRYLREAQALLPDSTRIQDAVAWASQDAVVRVGEAQTGTREVAPTPRTPAASAGPTTPRSAEKTAQAAAQAFGETVGQIKDKLAGIHLPKVHARRVRLSGPMISLLTVIATVVVVIVGIRLLRGEQLTVQAYTLPTPVPNPTSTPTVGQQTEALWVQTDVAFTQANWDAAISALERIRELDPHSDEARKQLAAACYQRGVGLVAANDIEGAQVELDRAVRLDSSYQPLQELRRQLKLYNDGVAAYWAQDWPMAVQRLKKSYDLNPQFRDTQVMLSDAYYQLGQERAQAEVWDESRDALEACLALQPERADAQGLLTQVMDVLIPPRRIEVSLNNQVVTVYENNAVKYTFPCCTGRSTAPTLPGRYSVLDKLPMAYASKWDLDMPNWLGIYWAGGSENGFHALPLRGGRQVLWSDSMGRPCSFGCIVLRTDDSAVLYEWAEIGTVVLVDW